MKWRKIGKIFNPKDFPEFANYYGFSQSPQALVLHDRVRIYFSIREVDRNGKYVSRIAFVDFDRKLKEVLSVSSHEVIKPGTLGAFDEHGIFPISPLQVDDKILAYTCGWSRRVSVSVETAIGLVQSRDGGFTFERSHVGPIMSSSLKEPFLVGDAFVRIFNKVFHMWYIFGTTWKQFPGENIPDRVYKIGHATSSDGILFKRESQAIIEDKLGVDECQALPTVIHHNGNYHMIFCYRYAAGFRKDRSKAYRLGYACSADLQSWKRQDNLLGIKCSSDSWDSDMMCYPHLFKCDGLVYLLYNGNEFGKYGFGLAVLEE